MAKNKHIFYLADLLYRKIKEELGRDEEAELEKWLSENGENSRLAEELKQTVAFREKERKYRLFDKYYDYESLHRRIRKERRKRVVRYAVAAAVFLIPFLICLIYWKFPQGQQEIYYVKNDLPPGKAIATLVLEDGTVKRLGKENFVLASGNVVATNHNHQLVYQSGDSVVWKEAERFHTIEVPRGGEYFLELSDHSRIWLNSESSIRFPVTFRGKERKVKVSGEVYMEIARDTSRPFRVETEAFQVQVLGTEFNIRAYPDEMRAAATLVKGKVEITDRSGDTYLLKPSEQFTYDVERQKVQIETVEPDLYTFWKDGGYIFKTQSLENILNTISRWYDLEIFYANSNIKNITYSGRIKRYESATVLLDFFERLGGVKFEISGKTVVVRKD